MIIIFVSSHCNCFPGGPKKVPKASRSSLYNAQTVLKNPARLSINLQYLNPFPVDSL